MRKVQHLIVIYIVNLLQVSVRGQSQNMLIAFDGNERNRIMLTCLDFSTTQPATFTFTNPLNGSTVVHTSTDNRYTFTILPENETLVSCRLPDDNSVKSETVAIAALPRLIAITTIIHNVFSDSTTFKLVCPLETGQLSGLISPYEFLWNVRLEGSIFGGTDTVTNANGTYGVFHYGGDTNNLLQVELQTLLVNTQYAFQCLGRVRRCNSTYYQNERVCGEEVTSINNSPYISFNFVDPVIITTNVHITQDWDIYFSCTVTKGDGDITIKWELDGVVYDGNHENCIGFVACTVEERDSNEVILSTLIVHNQSSSIGRVMDPRAYKIVCIVNQTVSDLERPEGLSETIKVKPAYKSQKRVVAQLILFSLPSIPTQTLTADIKSTAAVSPKDAVQGLLTFKLTLSTLVVLLFLVVTLSQCIFFYFFCTNPGRALGKKICCCIHNGPRPPVTVNISDQVQVVPSPVVTASEVDNVSFIMTASVIDNSETRSSRNLSSNFNADEADSEQVHQPHFRATAADAFTLIENSAQMTAETRADPGTETEQNLDNNEATSINYDIIGELTTLENEIEDSSTSGIHCQQENHLGTMCFTYTPNSAYAINVGTAPEIITKQNEAYESVTYINEGYINTTSGTEV